MQATFKKKTSGEPARPFMDVPDQAMPVPAKEQMGGASPAADPANPWAAFEARRDRAADMSGIRRTNTVERPVMEEDRASYLSRAAGDTALSVDRRRAAGREFMDLNADRRQASGQASMERQTFVQAAGAAQAGQAKAEGVLEGKQIMADAMRDQAATGAQGRKETQEVKNQGQQAAEAERTRRAVQVKELMNQGRLDVANVYAMAGRDRAEIEAETDLAVADLNKQGKVQAAEILGKAKGKIDPMLFMSMSPEQQQQLAKMNGVESSASKPDPYSPAEVAAKPAAEPANEKMVSFNDREKAAYNWARQNPNDPKAKAIMKKLGL
jgi:hypothetical protein